MAVRVLLADDHALIRVALRGALERDGGFEVLAEAESGAQVLPLVHRLRPDLVLMDMRMPGMDGLQALDRIKAERPEVKVVIISASTEPDIVNSALSRGASGFLVKSISPDDLPSVLRQAIAGTAWFPIGEQRTPDAQMGAQLGMTDRELDVLRSLVRGLSNKQISAELFVSEQTVKFHVTNIYRKLDVANRAGAIAKAAQFGLVSGAPPDDVP